MEMSERNGNDRVICLPIGRFREAAEGAAAPLFSCILKIVLKRLRYFIAACPEKWSFHSGRGGGGRVGDSAPSSWIFWIRPCYHR